MSNPSSRRSPLASAGSLQRFVRCARCQLPHPANTIVCPVDGGPIVAKASPLAIPAATTIIDEPQTKLVSGTVIDRRYEIGPLLGTGAMGAVYEARHLLLGRRVAIKVIALPEESEREARDRFFQEGRLLATIEHPNVVTIHDLGLHAGAPYLVMERLDGETLEARIADEQQLRVDEVASVGREALLGLSAAHRAGVLHGDLKPPNVFLVRGARATSRVKLVDFGLSKAIRTRGGRRDDSLIVTGTPAYLAPEVVIGAAPDMRADVWALGVTLYEALAGKLPFTARAYADLMREITTTEPPPLTMHRRDVPLWMERAIVRALAKDPADRFASAEEMLASWERVGATTLPPARGTALIAETDEAAMNEARAAARELGLVPFVARDGHDALELLGAIGAPKLLFANLGLPGADGFELLRALAAADPECACAVVVRSPIPTLRRVAALRARELGVRAVIGGAAVKPLAAVFAEALGPLPASAASNENATSGESASAAPSIATAPLRNEREEARLARIEAMGAVSEPTASLQALVEEAARALRMPVAAVTIMLADRQWFKAHVGIEGELLRARGTARAVSICHHVVEGASPLVVPDARKHPLFADNPLVRAGGLGSYAGAPVIAPTGEVLGTFCTIDRKPRPIARQTVEDLVAMARRVAGELELCSLTRSGRFEGARFVTNASRRVVEADSAITAMAGTPRARLIGLDRDELVALIAPAFASYADLVGKTRVLPAGPYAGYEEIAAAEAGAWYRWSAWPEMEEGELVEVETLALVRVRSS